MYLDFIAYGLVTYRLFKNDAVILHTKIVSSVHGIISARQTACGRYLQIVFHDFCAPVSNKVFTGYAMCGLVMVLSMVIHCFCGYLSLCDVDSPLQLAYQLSCSFINHAQDDLTAGNEVIPVQPFNGAALPLPVAVEDDDSRCEPTG